MHVPKPGRRLKRHGRSLFIVTAVAGATALVAGVITRIVLVPTGDLVAVPLLIRVGAVGGGFLVFFVAQRSMLLGVLAGETIMIAGAWFTQAQ